MSHRSNATGARIAVDVRRRVKSTTPKLDVLRALLLEFYRPASHNRKPEATTQAYSVPWRRSDA